MSCKNGFSDRNNVLWVFIIIVIICCLFGDCD